jgi:hypothetical protein
MDSNITCWKDAEGRYVGYLKSYPERRFCSSNLQSLRAELVEYQQMIRAMRVWEAEGGRLIPMAPRQVP